MAAERRFRRNSATTARCRIGQRSACISRDPGRMSRGGSRRAIGAARNGRNSGKFRYDWRPRLPVLTLILFVLCDYQ